MAIILQVYKHLIAGSANIDCPIIMVPEIVSDVMEARDSTGILGNVRAEGRRREEMREGEGGGERRRKRMIGSSTNIDCPIIMVPEIVRVSWKPEVAPII